METFNKTISIILESVVSDKLEQLKLEFKEEHEEWDTPLYEFVDELDEVTIEELVPIVYSHYFGDVTQYRGEVYHQTTMENWLSIKNEGIKASDKTRGISNRSTGVAIFTSVEIDEMNSYGDVTIRIDLSLAPNIETSLEEPIMEVYRKNQIMAMMGGDHEEFRVDSSDGLQDTTLVVFGEIPLDAIELIE